MARCGNGEEFVGEEGLMRGRVSRVEVWEGGLEVEEN